MREETGSSWIPSSQLIGAQLGNRGQFIETQLIGVEYKVSIQKSIFCIMSKFYKFILFYGISSNLMLIFSWYQRFGLCAFNSFSPMASTELNRDVIFPFWNMALVVYILLHFVPSELYFVIVL